MAFLINKGLYIFIWKNLVSFTLIAQILHLQLSSRHTTCKHHLLEVLTLKLKWLLIANLCRCVFNASFIRRWKFTPHIIQLKRDFISGTPSVIVIIICILEVTHIHWVNNSIISIKMTLTQDWAPAFAALFTWLSKSSSKPSYTHPAANNMGALSQVGILGW